MLHNAVRTSRRRSVKIFDRPPLLPLIHLNEFPVRRTVARPQTSVAMDPHKASTSDDIVAFGGLEGFESLVGSFAQVVVVQTADLCKWLFVCMAAHCSIPNKKQEREYSSLVKPKLM